MTAQVIMDDKGDRATDFWLQDLAADSKFTTVAKLHIVKPGQQVGNKITKQVRISLLVTMFGLVIFTTMYR